MSFSIAIGNTKVDNLIGVVQFYSFPEIRPQLTVFYLFNQHRIFFIDGRHKVFNVLLVINDAHSSPAAIVIYRTDLHRVADFLCGF